VLLMLLASGAQAMLPDGALLRWAGFVGSSLIASPVNDGGFWLVKEYFNMNVPQTVATWTVLETIISIVGLAGVLLLGVVVS
jgi:H+/gluconate symporter-like permease